MKNYLFVLVLLGAAVAQAQTTAPTTARGLRGGRGRGGGPPAAPMPTAAVTGGIVGDLVYPTNMATIDTPKAGILGLRAIDIPRYTQTGPLPNPPPTRPGIIPATPHNPNLPTIWTIGDSTVRTGYNGTGDDTPGEWGWGCPFVGYFDLTKVNVVNHAAGGTTSGSFYYGQWKGMVDQLKKGDVVLLQFGTNSGGVEIAGIGDESREGQPGRNGAPAQMAHTFGYFLRQFISETRAHGTTPVVCSLIPRNGRGPDGKARRDADRQALWARQVAAAEKADFVDLNELIARKYDPLDKAAEDALFQGSPHTSWTGAVLNAETAISGLKALKDDPCKDYYLPQVSQIPAAPELSYPAP
jgi:lysophospholipase L1-like esterase